MIYFLYRKFGVKIVKKKLKFEQKKELSDSINLKDSDLWRRAQAILFSEQNLSLIEFFQLTRYSFSYILNLKNKYLKDGLKSLESKKKERKLGRLLTPSQREQIGIILNSKNPSDFWPGAQLTWSLSHLAALINVITI